MANQFGYLDWIGLGLGLDWDWEDEHFSHLRDELIMAAP